MKIKVGLIQDSPIFFDKAETLEKIETLVGKYANQGFHLLVFPESFIPGYPRGFTFGTKVGSRSDQGREIYHRFRENSFDLNGGELKKLESLSRVNNLYLVVGVTEKQNGHGSLYCSMLYISPTEGLLGVHRKIKPTGAERLIWAESDADSLVTFESKIGKLGGLICWENYMPLARMAMYKKGVEIYIAPTADSRESWTATMRHIAMEGRCFVLGCNQYATEDIYPEEYSKLLDGDDSANNCPGGSVIVSPMGEILAGPLFNESGIVSAELNLEDIPKSKLDFDVIGHYSRNDLFKFEVVGQPEMIKEKAHKKTLD
ncbi:MAG: nitrilase [Pseudozobellia sp.]|nr:nitrilase [Pseudozobellia sp.]MBG49796.1 nitrilase [Pseudozobellia sp.]|tara:strand:- start:375 stop:1322 length:948 start_codon:yes stop_codon:yes gene_type:complete